eukprot:TRINITY_DN5918_c0_g1_i1.p1 TRINITY_DN5918_c0_g1~~TRINITY_DN5918_c0_g1_i1.p1  ORF type:complete len:469 (+),score=131.32 TRINITY_DN5918_c0_g1_i1:578-1984(+)
MVHHDQTHGDGEPPIMPLSPLPPLPTAAQQQQVREDEDLRVAMMDVNARRAAAERECAEVRCELVEVEEELEEVREERDNLFEEVQALRLGQQGFTEVLQARDDASSQCAQLQKDLANANTLILRLRAEARLEAEREANLCEELKGFRGENIRIKTMYELELSRLQQEHMKASAEVARLQHTSTTDLIKVQTLLKESELEVGRLKNDLELEKSQAAALTGQIEKAVAANKIVVDRRPLRLLVVAFNAAQVVGCYKLGSEHEGRPTWTRDKLCVYCHDDRWTVGFTSQMATGVGYIRSKDKEGDPQAQEWLTYDGATNAWKTAAVHVHAVWHEEDIVPAEYLMQVLMNTIDKMKALRKEVSSANERVAVLTKQMDDVKVAMEGRGTHESATLSLSPSPNREDTASVAACAFTQAVQDLQQGSPSLKSCLGMRDAVANLTNVMNEEVKAKKCVVVPPEPEAGDSLDTSIL